MLFLKKLSFVVSRGVDSILKVLENDISLSIDFIYQL